VVKLKLPRPSVQYVTEEPYPRDTTGPEIAAWPLRRRSTFSPFRSETASTTVVGGGSASAQAQLSDYFELVSSSTVAPGTQVALIITASGAVTQSQVSSGNSAQLYFGDNLGTTLIASACTNPFSGGCSGLSNQSSFSIARTQMVTVGVQNLLTLASRQILLAPIPTTLSPASSIQSLALRILTTRSGMNLFLPPGVGNVPSVPRAFHLAHDDPGLCRHRLHAYRRKSTPTFRFA